jgi:hypothetical protein
VKKNGQFMQEDKLSKDDYLTFENAYKPHKPFKLPKLKRNIKRCAVADLQDGEIAQWLGDDVSPADVRVERRRLSQKKNRP